MLWLTSLAALLGVWLNIQRHVACFYLWMATNAVWAITDWRHGLPQQATLQAVYFVLSIYGAWRWHRNGPPPVTTTRHWESLR